LDVLATKYCGTEKESNQIHSEEWVFLLGLRSNFAGTVVIRVAGANFHLSTLIFICYCLWLLLKCATSWTSQLMLC